MSGWAGDAPVEQADTVAAVAGARRVREELGLREDQSPSCWLKVAERALGLRVVVARMPTSLSGAYLPVSDAPVIFLNGAHPPVRQRFTLAHEIGHHALAHGAAPRVLRAQPVREPDVPVVDAPTVAATPRPSRPLGRRGAREREANFFASELLAPAGGLGAAIGHTGGAAKRIDLELVVRLAAGYGTSVPMILVRLETAGHLDRARKVALDEACTAEEHLRLHRELGLQSLGDEVARLAAAPEELPRLPAGGEATYLARLLSPAHRPAGPMRAQASALRRLLGVA